MALVLKEQHLRIYQLSEEQEHINFKSQMVARKE